MARDHDGALLLGLEVDHGGSGASGIAVDQEFASVRRPERGSEVARPMSSRAVGIHHPDAAPGPRLVARMEREGDPLVAR